MIPLPFGQKVQSSVQQDFKGESTSSSIETKIPTIDITKFPPIKGSIAYNILDDMIYYGTGTQWVKVGTTFGGTFDIIIAGVGTAGAVAFRRISDGNPNLSILGITTGVNNNENPVSKYPFIPTDPELNAPGIAAGIAGNPRLAEMFQNYNWMADYYNRATFPIPAGQGVGGSSMINFLFAARPSAGFHNYASTFAGAFSPQWIDTACSAIYQAMETYIGPPAQPNRGYSGPFRILQQPIPANPPYGDSTGDILNSLASQSLAPADNGLSITLDYNNDVNLTLVKSNQAYLYPDGGSPIGVSRSSAAEAYLGANFITAQGFSAVGRNNRIVMDAIVLRVLFDESNNAIGVEAIVNGQLKTYFAKEKVIICAGSMRTPGILERSGIGSASLLSSIGITSIVDNPNVGENLSNHSMPSAWIQLDQSAWIPTAAMNGFMQLTPTTPYGYPRQLNIGAGNGGSLYVQLANAYGTNNAMNKALGIPVDSLFNYLVFNLIVQPTSRGSVHLINNMPQSQPEYIYNLNSPNDLFIMRSAYQLWKRTEIDLQLNNPAMNFVLNYPDNVAFAGYPGAPTIVFTASIAGTTMTVTAVASGTLEPQMTVLSGGVWSTAPDAVITQGTMISGQIFPLLGGESIGGIGRYTVNISQTVGSTAMHGDFLEMYAASFNVVNAHMSGTCRMGDRVTQQGVVDGQLHVYGVQKLMVADNSIWPVTPDINTTMSAMLAGYQAATFCLATI